jgi:hypothetical protein
MLNKVLLVIIILMIGMPARAGYAGYEYSYRFENPRFDISFVEIKLHENGEGNLLYKKRDEDSEIPVKLKLLPGTIYRLGELFNELRFLDTTESYQAEKQLPHLGTVTLGMKADQRSRETSFNYTSNRAALRLVELFRAIENQERRLIELTLARQYSPLDLPKQLKNLEDDLKRNRIAEPSQMLPLLTEIALDDSLPLIARNNAEKLAKQIKASGGSS